MHRTQTNDDPTPNTIIRSRCPVCESKKSQPYITTRAHMHVQNEENYVFNECARCKSVFLINPVNQEELSRYYSKFYLPYRGSRAWGKFSEFVERSDAKLNRSRVKTVKNVTDLTAKTKILDLGCGKPDFLQSVYDDYGCECYGTDFSNEGWKEGNYPGLNLMQGDIHDLEFDVQFDVITAWHYLEHDYRPLKTVKLLHKLLKPDGILVFEVPHHESITAKMQKEHWQGWHSPRHLTLFSTRGIKTLFSNKAWKQVKYKKSGTLDAFTLWWLGHRQKQNTDWSASMEKYFWPLVFLKVITAPVFLLESFFPMGIQTGIFKKRESDV